MDFASYRLALPVSLQDGRCEPCSSTFVIFVPKGA